MILKFFNKYWKSKSSIEDKKVYKNKILVDYYFSPGIIIPPELIVMGNFASNISLSPYSTKNGRIESMEHYNGDILLDIHKNERKYQICHGGLFFDDIIWHCESEFQININRYNKKFIYTFYEIEEINNIVKIIFEELVRKKLNDEIICFELLECLLEAGRDPSENPNVLFVGPIPGLTPKHLAERWVRKFITLVVISSYTGAPLLLHPKLYKFWNLITEFPIEIPSNNEEKPHFYSYYYPYFDALNYKKVFKLRQNEIIQSFRNNFRELFLDKKLFTEDGFPHKDFVSFIENESIESLKKVASSITKNAYAKEINLNYLVMKMPIISQLVDILFTLDEIKYLHEYKGLTEWFSYLSKFNDLKTDSSDK